MTAVSTDRARHWDAVYQAKAPTAVSWYRPHLAQSLACIRACPAGRDARVIDVGGGASTLVDDLLDDGFRYVTVLDVSEEALRQARARLGPRAARAQWIAGDVTHTPLPERAYDVWHDRAVFHFLAGPDDRQRYREQLHHAVRPGGQAVIATFALDGPPRCSGLDVVRYSPATLRRALGAALKLVASAEELHQTPSGATQAFLYCRFQLQASTR